MGYNDNHRLPTTTLNKAATGPPPLIAKPSPPPKTQPPSPRRGRQQGNMDNVQATTIGNKLHLVEREFVDFGDNKTETNLKRLSINYDDIEDRDPKLTADDIADILFEKLKVRVGALMKAYWATGKTVRELEEEMRNARHFSNGNIGKYYAIINANHRRKYQ